MNAASPAAATSGPPVPDVPLGEFSELLRLIYKGALESLPWESALESLREHLESNWITLVLRPPAVDREGLVLVGKKGSRIRIASTYSQYGYALDPFVKLPMERVMTIEEVIDNEAWQRTEFYKQFIEPCDVFYMMGVDFRTQEGIECHIRLCRPLSGRPFSAADKALVSFLLAHWKLAIHLHSQLDLLESERKFYSGAIDRMLVGTVILDETGNIIKTNTVADEIFRENDGITVTHSALKANYSLEDKELKRLIRQALSEPVGSAPRLAEALTITRPSGQGKFGIVVRAIPLSEWSEGKKRPAVAVIIHDPERKSQASQDIVQRLFDFTPAEGTLALLLANGLTLDEAAEKLNIRKNTARAHLRSIFSKTGVTRQTMLVRLVLGSVTSLG